MKLKLMQQAAAETVENLAQKTGRTAAELAVELAAGELRGLCTAEELAGWHGLLKRQQRAAEIWNQSPEIPVDPQALERVEEVAAEREEQNEAGVVRQGEIAAGMLRLMDRRLLRDVVTWKETAVALREGEEIVEVKRGAGRERTASGDVVEWVAFAVVTLTAQRVVCRVFPECVFKARREPGWNGCVHGAVRIRRAVLVRRVDNGATSQAVGTLLLLYKGEAAGVRTHADLASMTGGTRANGSAKARRMAAESGHANFPVLRCRETVGKKREKKKNNHQHE